MANTIALTPRAALIAWKHIQTLRVVLNKRQEERAATLFQNAHNNLLVADPDGKSTPTAAIAWELYYLAEDVANALASGERFRSFDFRVAEIAARFPAIGVEMFAAQGMDYEAAQVAAGLHSLETTTL